jgi:hypothetical protein
MRMDYSRKDGFQVSIETIGKNFDGVYCNVSSPFFKYGPVEHIDTITIGKLSESFAIKALRVDVERVQDYVVSRLFHSMNGNTNCRMRKAAAEETLSFISDMGYAKLYCPTAYRPYFGRIKKIIFKDDIKIPRELSRKTGLDANG